MVLGPGDTATVAGAEMKAQVYIARHERREAAEAWKDRLTPEQYQHLLDNEKDFWLNINYGKTELLMVEDEG